MEGILFNSILIAIVAGIIFFILFLKLIIKGVLILFLGIAIYLSEKFNFISKNTEILLFSILIAFIIGYGVYNFIKTKKEILKPDEDLEE
jgi:membrane protein implicated in regulation of membrane protease activity